MGIFDARKGIIEAFDQAMTESTSTTAYKRTGRGRDGEKQTLEAAREIENRKAIDATIVRNRGDQAFA